jgi:nicotinamidase-related amidase
MLRSALLIIDPQNDFCAPDGSLYVPGADDDMQRLVQFMHLSGHLIDHIVVTLDSHTRISIFHPSWFQDSEGNSPPPFTIISSQDLMNKRWVPRYEPEWTPAYIDQLESQGAFQHTIWPEHVLIGTWGHSVFPPLMEAILQWSSTYQRRYTPVVKGLSDKTEHYGIFAAQVVRPDEPQTSVNRQLITHLNDFDRIYVAGEASSHCVATSIHQLFEHAPQLISRCVLLEDCTSPVPGFEHLSFGTYQQAREMGMVSKRSTDLND